jgi:hypothetical protein
MSRKVGFGAALVAAGFLAASALRVMPVGATALSKDEMKCESATGKSQGKFVASKQKCVSKCMDALAKGKVTGGATVCDPNGGSAANITTCISTAVGKAVTGETKKCPSGSCPECYGEANGDPNNGHSGDCTNDASVRVSDPNNPNATETQLDPFFGPDGGIIYCDSGGFDPNVGTQKDKIKCEDAVAKNGAKLVGALNKCTSKCLSSAAKEKTTGHCSPPVDGGSDTKEASCVSTAKGKTAAGIDKKCKAGTIACDNGNAIGAALYAGSGAEWANVIEGRVNAQYANTYCSPSGAFLE